MTSREELAVKQAHLSGLIDGAIEAVESDDEDWKDTCRKVLPMMRSFTEDLMEYALAELERLNTEAEKRNAPKRHWWKRGS
jgi:hypothetical protein